MTEGKFIRAPVLLICIVNTEPSGRSSVLVLAGDADEAADVADALESADAAPAPVDGSPRPSVDDAVSPTSVDDLATTDVAIVLDAEGLDAIRGQNRSCRVVAFVDDPATEPATDPLVDVIATTPADLDATLRWFAPEASPASTATTRRERLRGSSSSTQR